MRYGGGGHLPIPSSCGSLNHIPLLGDTGGQRLAGQRPPVGSPAGGDARVHSGGNNNIDNHNNHMALYSSLIIESPSPLTLDNNNNNEGSRQISSLLLHTTNPFQSSSPLGDDDGQLFSARGNKRRNSISSPASHSGARSSGHEPNSLSRLSTAVPTPMSGRRSDGISGDRGMTHVNQHHQQMPSSLANDPLPDSLIVGGDIFSLGAPMIDFDSDWKRRNFHLNNLIAGQSLSSDRAPQGWNDERKRIKFEQDEADAANGDGLFLGLGGLGDLGRKGQFGNGDLDPFLPVVTGIEDFLPPRNSIMNNNCSPHESSSPNVGLSEALSNSDSIGSDNTQFSLTNRSQSIDTPTVLDALNEIRKVLADYVTTQKINLQQLSDSASGRFQTRDDFKSAMKQQQRIMQAQILSHETAEDRLSQILEKLPVEFVPRKIRQLKRDAAQPPKSSGNSLQGNPFKEDDNGDRFCNSGANGGHREGNNNNLCSVPNRSPDRRESVSVYRGVDDDPIKALLNKVSVTSSAKHDSSSGPVDGLLGDSGEAQDENSQWYSRFMSGSPTYASSASPTSGGMQPQDPNYYSNRRRSGTKQHVANTNHRCSSCSGNKTPQWRYFGQKRFCNACYMRMKRQIQSREKESQLNSGHGRHRSQRAEDPFRESGGRLRFSPTDDYGDFLRNGSGAGGDRQGQSRAGSRPLGRRNSSEDSLESAFNRSSRKRGSLDARIGSLSGCLTGNLCEPEGSSLLDSLGPSRGRSSGMDASGGSSRMGLDMGGAGDGGGRSGGRRAGSAVTSCPPQGVTSSSPAPFPLLLDGSNGGSLRSVSSSVYPYSQQSGRPSGGGGSPIRSGTAVPSGLSDLCDVGVSQLSWTGQDVGGGFGMVVPSSVVPLGESRRPGGGRAVGGDGSPNKVRTGR